MGTKWHQPNTVLHRSDGTSVITLTKGQVTVIDTTDYPLVARHRWHAYFSGWHWYARRHQRFTNGKYTVQDMARFIMGLEHGDFHQVDHKSHEETLNNTRENLRVTLNQNQQNIGKPKDNTSGFKGVSWHNSSKKWQVSIRFKGEPIYLGLFPTKELAAQAYDAAAIKYHKDFAVTNEMLAAAA